MTVSNTNNTMRYTGGGGTTLPYTFQIYASSDLVVTKVLTSTGAVTTLALTTDYTVDGVGVSGGGNVYLVSDPGATYTIVIQRSLAITQGTHYVPNDPFPATSHETALDRLTMIGQQIQEQVNRCVKLGSANTGISVTLPIAQAGYNLQWSGDGLSLVNAVPSDSAAAISAAAALASQNAAAASAAAAAVSAAAINLPSLSGGANKFLRVNAGATGYTLITTIPYSGLTLTGAVLNADLAGSIADSKLLTISTAGKVSGAAITSLASVPSGAGKLPIVNIASGTPDGTKYIRDDGTLASIHPADGGTSFAADGTVYQNTGAGPLMVIGSFYYNPNHDAGWSGCYFNAYVGATNSPATFSGQVKMEMSNNVNQSLCPGSLVFVVPPGYYWKITSGTFDAADNPGGVNFIHTWQFQ